jgi:phosphopantetheinyl transferase (holo-ACP synthase)
VISFLHSVPVDEARKHRRSLVKAHCTTAESRELANRGAASVAGSVALKAALVDSCRHFQADTPVVTRDFGLSHNKRGAPVLTSFPAGADPFAGHIVRISLTHTRTTAHGLVAIQRKRDA